MRRLRRPFRTGFAVLKALLLVGCNLISPPATSPVLPTVEPTQAPLPPDAGSPEPGWDLIAPGAERRFVQPPNLGPFASVVIHRFDPARVRFRAHYSPSTPLWIGDWRSQVPGAVAFINGNFFDPSSNPLGLVVSDGTPYGQSYVGRGGMFATAGDQVWVRSLITDPYAGGLLDTAVQGFPMLITDGVANTRNGSADRATRRTVVAQDNAGRILWISTTLIGMTLNDMATFLSESDLQIVHALNLDGGGSTMLASPGSDIPSFDAVPVILAAYPVE
ncbi:MAG: phosphodiester glycosidase family protein [Chloroflexi bacterium]|nr:phosphodiester glycosidase family protein [Chloroflexota bacterium]